MEIDQDLAALLSRSLTLDPSMTPELRMSIENELQARAVAYSVSQHYHHSSHNAGTTTTQHQMPRSLSEPPPRPTCEMLLRQNGIDPAALLPPQIQLFRIADSAQQDRLLELWRICPPTRNIEDPSLAWTATTVEQEEDRTRQRLMRSHCQQVIHEMERRNKALSLDGTPTQAADGSWDPEPYMSEGYLGLMQEYGYDPQAHGPSGRQYAQSASSYKPATDPMYRTAVGWQGYGPAGVQMDQMDVAM